MELHTRQSLLDIHGIDVPPRHRSRRQLLTIIQLVRRLWQSYRQDGGYQQFTKRTGRWDIGIEPHDPEHRDRRLATGHDDRGQLS